MRNDLFTKVLDFSYVQIIKVITEIPFDLSQKYETVGLPRPNRRATVYFGTQLISVGCILLKKNLNVGAANRPAFRRQVPLFYAKCPSKTFSRLAGLPLFETNVGNTPLHSSAAILNILKLKCRQYPAIHINYSCSNCTISN